MKKYKYMLLSLALLLLMGCEQNDILAIEQANTYEWQKYMSNEEFAKVSDGMTYMDVVEIAGGAGKLQHENKKQDTATYVWLDERLLTRAYEIQFKKGEVMSKEMLERRGHSNRE